MAILVSALGQFIAARIEKKLAFVRIQRGL